MKKLKFRERKEELFKLDLGAGKGASTPDGFIPYDLHKWKGIKVCDLRKRWPWKANSVDEVNCHYLLQYFSADERVHFANELYRVLKPGSKAMIVTPHWCCSKAFGDVHAKMQVTEAWYMTLSKGWRDAQNYVDASGLKCDFSAGIGYGMHPGLLSKNLEYQQHAVTFWKEAVQDLIVTLTKL